MQTQLQEKTIVPEIQHQTPYLDALLEYVNDKVISFHTPGHKHGAGLDKKLQPFISKETLNLDLTQVLGLDDLHQPRSVIKKAQELAAQAYGADYSFFLINGSSSGNQAMMMAVCSPNDTVIIPRNIHRSTVAAMILSGINPVYAEPVYDYELYFDHTTSVPIVKEAIEKHPEAKAVLILSPTYYGVTANMKALVDLIHSYGKVAMVDEAWGPHLHFHPKLPISAMQAGADICVNSTHKLLAGMSQASMLHARKERINIERLQSVLRIFLSTSPSCVLLASLDVARMQMATQGRELLDNALHVAGYIREEINKIDGLYCFGRDVLGKPGAFDFDETKITIQVKGLGYTGYEVEKILRYKYKIQPELADLFNVLFLVTIGDTMKNAYQLVNAFKEISASRSKEERNSNRFRPNFEMPDWPKAVMRPRDAFFAESEIINLDQSVGRVSSEIVTAYPPGIPILCPGEQITKETVEYLQIELVSGFRLQGIIDNDHPKIKVVKQA